MMPRKNKLKTLPAVAVTAVSMVLTLAVVVMWLGAYVPWPLALVVGLGLDGGWLAVLAYERRMAAQGDHNATVTGIGWGFGVAAAGILVLHALTIEGTAAWLAVSWLPLAAKALWFVHGLWERTALTEAALAQIRAVRQDARDQTAVARAQLAAHALTEETRLKALTDAGVRVARAQAAAASALSKAQQSLGDAVGTHGAPAGWELPSLAPAPSTAALEAAPNTAEHAAEDSGQDDADRSNVVTLTRPNTGEHAPNIADLAREQVRAGASTTEAVANILEELPNAKADSVAATVRRERRKADGRAYM